MDPLPGDSTIILVIVLVFCFVFKKIYNVLVFAEPIQGYPEIQDLKTYFPQSKSHFVFSANAVGAEVEPRARQQGKPGATRQGTLPVVTQCPAPLSFRVTATLLFVQPAVTSHSRNV